MLLGSALTFAIVQPIKVLRRIRLAPGYALVDQSGAQYTSESSRGVVTLYAFTPLECGAECERMSTTMREVAARSASEVDLGEVDFRMVTITLADSPSTDELAAAAARAGADGETWRFIGGPADRVRTVVGTGFRRYFAIDAAGAVDFDPGFALVDTNGVIRGEYRYQTLANDADKILSQVGLLGDELRQTGLGSLAYGAAHLFLCYG